MKKNRFLYLVGLSALLLVGMSGYYSVVGISSLFSGRRLFAAIMAGSLEFGKITVASYLYRKWKSISKLMRTYFLVAVFILVCISSAGIYSYLTNAYHLTMIKTQAVDIKVSALEAEEQSLQERKEDLEYEIKSTDDQILFIRNAITRNDEQLANLYKASIEDTMRTWYNNIYRLRNEQNNYKEEIVILRDLKDQYRNNIVEINNSLKEIWKDSGEIQVSDEFGDIGPLKKLGELFNVEMDSIVKFFIFIILIIFDPLGVLLVVAFNKLQMEHISFNNILKKNKVKKTSNIDRVLNSIEKKDKDFKKKKLLYNDEKNINVVKRIKSNKVDVHRLDERKIK